MNLTPKSINISDQTTKTLGLYLSKALGTVTLATGATVNTRTCTLVAGHGVTTGNLLIFQSGSNMYQALVVNVDTDTITLDTPFDRDYSTSTTITKATVDMNVNGSGTTQVFTIAPVLNSWDITQLIFVITDNVAMDDSTFGGIAALTNGIALRKKNTYYDNIGNVKTNSDFRLRGFELLYSDKAPSGSYGIVAKKKYAGQSEVGVALRVEASKNEELQLLVQDNLSDLTLFRGIVIGHVLD